MCDTYDSKSGRGAGSGRSECATTCASDGRDSGLAEGCCSELVRWWRLVAENRMEGIARDPEVDGMEGDGVGDPARDEEGGESSSEKSPSDEALSSNPLSLVRVDGGFFAIFFLSLAVHRN